MDAILEPRAVGDITGAFCVPAYQRGYRWGPDEVGRLLDDIWASEGAQYYLQPVVVKAMPDGRWELVDGQQRLTTLYLIFQYMRDEGLKSVGAGFTLEYETRAESEAFLLSPSLELSGRNIDFHHIYGAYKVIRDWFERHEHRKQLAADKIYGYLFESVKVIWYVAALELELDSIALFTRLNVGRIPLSDAELVKALLLSRSRERPGVSDRSEQIAAQWDQFERELREPEVWSFVTAEHGDKPSHIGLILDTLANRFDGDPGLPRPRYYTFETLRPRIIADPQELWDQVVALQSLIVGWYEDRDIFHKVGFLVAIRENSFPQLVELAQGLTRRQLHEAIDHRIRRRLSLTASGMAALSYDTGSAQCGEVLLLMNVETMRRRNDSTARYSFHAHARGAWSLEHIHAQSAKEMKRDAKIWMEWLQLHRDALADLPGIDNQLRAELVAEVDEVLALIDGQQGQQAHRVGAKFDAIKVKVEEALTDNTGGADDALHSISNLALLASGDNSALSNSTFEVKRREILARDKVGGYIPACTRNVFLKYYTNADSQQIHYWGAMDREAYLQAILDSVGRYLIPEEVAE